MAPHHEDSRESGLSTSHKVERGSPDQSLESATDASNRLKPDTRYYSDRYSHPPSREPSKTRLRVPSREPPKTRSRVTSREPSKTRSRVPDRPPKATRTKSWPPSPIVEDEKESLAKESNPPLADSERNDAGSRGTIEQYPVVQFIPEEAELAIENGGHCPKDSEKEIRKHEELTKQRGRKATITEEPISLQEPALFAQREPSPYVFIPKAPPSDLDAAKPSAASRLKPSMDGKAEQQRPQAASEALRGTGKPVAARGPTYKPSTDTARDIHEQAVDSEVEGQGITSVRTPNRYSLNRSDLEDKELRMSLREMIAKPDAPSRLTALKAETGQMPRRLTDSASTIVRPRFEDSSQRPSLLNTRALSSSSKAYDSGNGFYVNGQSFNRKNGSRPSSPTRGVRSVPSSPPRSPRASAYSKNNSPKTGFSSKPGSRPTSRPSSPTSSDTSRASDRYEDNSPRRASTFPAGLEDKSQRKSRLQSSMIPPGPDALRPRVQVLSPSPQRSPYALPYPIDESELMPSESRQRYDSGKTSASYRAPGQGSEMDRSPLPSPRPSVSTDSQALARPTISTRPSTAETIPPYSPVSIRAPNNDLAHNSRAPVSSSKPFRTCPRMELSRSHQDWYGIEGYPAFNICPTCLDSNFADTSGDYFRKQPRKDYSAKTKCDFGSPWMRLAWVLTQQQSRTDLSLICAVARVDASHPPCTGDSPSTRPDYHSVTDPSRAHAPIDNFDVCASCTAKLETLIPALRTSQVLQPSPSNARPRRRKCDFRVESKRFPSYVELLLGINEHSQRTRTPPDFQPFLRLARQKAQTRECARDDMLQDEKWHFPPSLPQFTVCEECYSDVVWPAIADGSVVAARFNRTPALVRDEHGGTSCQLYSPRMRRVWRRAVKHADWEYLVGKAKQRKDMEARLHKRVEGLKRRSGGAGLGVVPEDVDLIVREWQEWE